MNKKGVTFLEVVVIILCIALLIIVLLPDIDRRDSRGNITHDISNLRSLYGIFISGQTDKKPMPKSVGHRFWLALFVGDPADKTTGVKIDNVYAHPSQAGNLINFRDDGRLSKDEIIADFQNALTNKIQGWEQLPKQDNLYTSYAGPRTLSAFLKKGSTQVIGCTGSRNGYGFYDDGFSVLRADQSAEFLLYEMLATETPDEWSADQDEPSWNSTLLKNVINIEPSANSQSEGR